MYVKRNEKGQIVLVSADPIEGCCEYLASDSSELLLFLNRQEAAERGHMRESDLDFVRVLEDVIELLVDKGVIRFTDLPKEAQDKFSERRSARRRIHSVRLLSETASDGDDLI